MEEKDELTIEEQYKALKKRKKKEKRNKAASFVGRHLTKNIIIILVVIAIIGGAAFGIKTTFFTDNKTTKLGFEDIGEFATQSAYCTVVSVTDKNRDFFGIAIPFTQTKYIYSYDTEIKAGYDFGKITYKVDENKKKIVISLPEVKVLSNEIKQDSMKVYHESESIFTPVTLTENNETLKKLKKTARKDAIANGLYNKARENAETLLKNFFSNEYDLKEYTVEFVDK